MAPEEAQHHLSFNVPKGFIAAGTMRFMGRIQGSKVQILLDSGSSNNFLQPRVAKSLKLPIIPSPQFQVMVGNGQTIASEGKVDELNVNIQGQDLVLPVYLLPITEADLVLRAKWLATLGPHIADYDTMTFRFCLQGKFITLYGARSKHPTQAEFHHMK